MAAPVRLASFHQVPVSSLDQQFSDLLLSIAANRYTVVHHLGEDSLKINSSAPIPLRLIEQELYDLIK